MSTDDTKPTLPKGPPPKQPAAPTGDPNRYPVARLAFVKQGGHDLFKSANAPSELRNGISKLEAGKARGGATIEIAYYPRLGHHRIVLTPPSAPPEVVMIPAEWCHWTPAEE